MEKVELQKEHRWLEKLVGEWTAEADQAIEPGKSQEPWTETGRSLHGTWVLVEGKGEMPGGGGAATTVMTLGYDPQKKRFVGTWIGSMMTHLWIYDGELDAAGKVLTLESEGPKMDAEGKLVEGQMAKYRDIMEFESDDHRVLTGNILGDDGEWHQFMTAHYRRKR